MKKILYVILGVSMLSFSSAYAERLHDWKDLEEAHNHIVDTIHELERAQAANHYDMKGHAAKAEEALRRAEHELHEAIEAAKRER
ncbi:MAG: hypothetical protein WCA63_01935 [Gallionella sp.]